MWILLLIIISLKKINKLNRIKWDLNNQKKITLTHLLIKFRLASAGLNTLKEHFSLSSITMIEAELSNSPQ